MAVALHQIKVKGLWVRELLGIKIEHSPGEHGTLWLKAGLGENEEERVLQETKAHQPISVFAEVEKGSTLLFCGLIASLKIGCEGKRRWMEVRAESYSRLLDLEKKSRTFQDPQMTYGRLIRLVLADYPGADCLISLKDKPAGDLIVQYRETDWEFLKRITSMLYTKIAASIGHESIRIMAGIPPISGDQPKYNIKEIKKDLGVREEWSQKGIKAADVDFLTYVIESDDICQIYQPVVCSGRSLLVRRCLYEPLGDTVRCRYELQGEGGLLEREKDQHGLTGLTLEGKVAEVKGDRLRLGLDIDSGKAGSHWFSYTTISASPDGSGWYCMPEKGDRVRLYFPTHRAEDSVAVGAVSAYAGEKGGEDRMKKPSEKYFGNIHGQQMILGEDGVCISCKDGSAKLTIEKDGAVSLEASEDITIRSRNDLSVKSEEKMVWKASESAKAACVQGGRLEMARDRKLNIRGTKVKID